jgi:peptide-methionine (R)-S-oxide reductase
MASEKLSDKPDEYWKKKLTRKQYKVARKKSTELPFSGKYNYTNSDGIYRCVACQRELFDSDTKFKSYSGWPSFTDPISKKALKYDTSRSISSLGRPITEVSCSNCGAHLGHVFPDGPVDRGGIRYCINSTSLDFTATKLKDA